MDNRGYLLKQLTSHRLTAWFLLAAAVLLVIPPAGCNQTEPFSQWDTNQDGFITADEVSDAKKQKFQRWVQAGDKDKDGRLDKQEFRTANEGLIRQLIVLLIVLGVTVLPAMVGNRLARALRMQDYGWKIGLVLCSLCIASAVTWFGWPPKLGIDLHGGVILIYEIDQEKTEQLLAIEQTDDEKTSSLQSEGPNINDLVQAIRRRINPGGVKEIVIRPYGDRQVEVIIPEVEAAEIDIIKQLISTSGLLEFLLVANSTDHQYIIGQAETKDPEIKIVTDSDKNVIARWVEVAREEAGPAGFGPSDYRGILPNDTLRNAKTGQIIQLSPSIKGEIRENPGKMIAVLAALGAEDVEVLMKVSPAPELNIKGSHLRSASSGFDNYGGPCINFRMTRRGANLMGSLTGENLPDKQTGNSHRLGIVMDGQLISAPTIQGRIDGQGQITGTFTPEEVNFLSGILRAGRLPAVLREEPISENRTSAILGADTVRKGKIAIAISLSSVLVFMFFYYRFSGVLACLALLMNLILVLALMILVKAAFTLPGLAGLVLTVGMSVDANVLIFERIREELNRGAALRMAIRNGFGRATTTIVDANVTTLITALVLYVIGTDQIKGFAVTLILGILMSMYTAIFCSRIVFDIFERKRWITKLRMMHILGETRFNFMGKRNLAAAFSILLIVVGLAAVVMRGKQIFDIDFNGGTSVQILLTERMRTDTVRDMVEDSSMVKDLPDVSVYGLQLQEEDIAAPEAQGGTFNSFKINTSRTGEEDGGDSHDGVVIVQNVLKKIFRDRLRRHVMQYGPLAAVTETTVSEAPLKESPPEKSEEKKPTSSPPSLPESTEEPPSTSPQPKEGDESRLGRPRYRFIAFADEEKKEEEIKTEQDPDSEPTEPNGKDSTQAPAPEAPRQRFGTELTFDHKINTTTLEALFREAAKEQGLQSIGLQLSYEGRATDSIAAFKRWDVAFALDMQQAGQLLKDVQAKLADMPVWLSSSKIGGKVAGDTQNMAIAALLTSLLGIVGYIWVRFQRVVFGLAAVVALVHDVLITLGALALSLWLSKSLGFLLIDEFKISLPVVAAFLTIIGYSLNDTIVVFDRIREVRGKSPDLNQDMINISINQTLSRTVLTSITTLLVVLILYTIGGQGIHAFAFALVVGVIVGTYSSIFVASPCLLWLMGTGKST